MNNLEVMFSSKSDEWATPDDLFYDLDEEFQFTLDAAASDGNHKCNMYYTAAEDGLSKSWEGERVFCNPPYSKIKDWVRKAFEESRNENTLVVLLIPSRTDTKYFHDYILHRSEVRFVKGRLKFGGGYTLPRFRRWWLYFAGLKCKEVYL